MCFLVSPCKVKGYVQQKSARDQWLVLSIHGVLQVVMETEARVIFIGNKMLKL